MRRPKTQRERGVALIGVVLSLAILIALVTDFAYGTHVELAQAAHGRDALVAEYAARGLLDISRLVIRVQQSVIDKFRAQIGDFQLASISGPLVSLFAGKPGETEGIGQMIGLNVAGIKGVGLGKNVDVDLKISSDDGRINVNCGGGFSSPNPQNQQFLGGMLYALFSGQAWNKVFEQADSTGQYVSREELVRAIVDWSDGDDRGYDLSQIPGLAALGSSQGSVEDYRYDSWIEPYRAHNNYYDTPGELHLVRGIRDDLWPVVSDLFTTYGGCRILLAAVGDLPMRSQLALLRGIVVASAKNPQDPGLTEPNLSLLSAHLAKELSFRAASFAPVADPAELMRLVGNPMTMAHLVLATDTAKPVSLIPVTLDIARLGALLQNARGGQFSRRTYRVEAFAKVGDITRKIVAVWDSNKVKQFTANPNKPGDARGAWVYYRED